MERRQRSKFQIVASLAILGRWDFGSRSECQAAADGHRASASRASIAFFLPRRRAMRR